jgi:small-conductance mechanosensitive channel
MESEWLQRAIVAGVVVLVTLVLARLADRALTRRLDLRPETLTRYRVLRRSVVAVIVAVGVLSALLVIPEVQAVAGSILASSAIIALVVGFAAQSTLANFIAGILIAVTQPLRIGDSVAVTGASGTVEEIGLTYTLIRAHDGARYFVPNAKLASDTIRNATIASVGHLAAVRVSVPLAADLDRVLELLVEEARNAPEAMPGKEPAASVTQLDAAAVIVTVETWAASAERAGALAVGLRRTALARLRAAGIYT